jgi:hypothetical protein
MYGGNIESIISDRQWLREVMHIDDIFDTLMVTYPRRSGKTMTETLAAAVTSLTQPEGNVVAINPKKHQARDWLTQCREHLALVREHDVYGWKEKAFRDGQVFELESQFTGKTVEIVSRGNAGAVQHVDALRGGGKRLFLLVCDEFYFFCDEAFSVLFPLAKYGCGIVMTSSMALRESNVYRMRTEAQYANGDRIVRTIDYRYGGWFCLV